MAATPSSLPASGRSRPNIVRPTLDDVDRAILAELSADARIPNNALAERVGIAPSTCLGRVRALRESGVIRGFHADVDPDLTGRPIQAMVAVRMQSHARGHLMDFMAEVSQLPEVRNTYLLGGAHDFFLHVATPDTEGLREFVIAHLSGNPDVALTETNLIFSHTQAWT
jgi:DNA-binding Lrp family transcriptional regulator